jgi:putative acetyltransferase
MDVTPQPSNAVSVRADHPLSDAARPLLAALTLDLAQRYADLGDDGSGGFSPDQAQGGGGIFLVAHLHGHAVGCAALRPLPGHAGVGEIKRMYVAPEARRQGVGLALLAALENVGRQLSYDTLRLETGIRQPEAIALYERAGYRRIPPFGRYIGNPVSVCFEKVVPSKTR